MILELRENKYLLRESLDNMNKNENVMNTYTEVVSREH